MKTLITLNIGLQTIANTRLDIHHALNAIAACGVSVTTSAVVAGEWEGKPEQTLFVQGFVNDPESIQFKAQLFLASRLLSQHCLALWHNGRGELIGPNPNGWEFNRDLFHFHPDGSGRGLVGEIQRETIDGLSECQSIQAKHRAKAGEIVRLTERDDGTGPIVDGWTKAGFVHYLTDTLIPDLREGGSEATARDFETALAFIVRD